MPKHLVFENNKWLDKNEAMKEFKSHVVKGLVVGDRVDRKIDGVVKVMEIKEKEITDVGYTILKLIG